MAKRFRNTWTHKEGHDPARIAQGKILNVNQKNWTVDVYSTFDRFQWFEIQVGSPYLHFTNGEGIYTMPEVGAQVMVALPSDTSPPFVLSFVAPMETSESTSEEAKDEDESKTKEAAPTTDTARPDAVSFSVGRYPAKPGDLVMRGRDGNFVILHRGGVLQIGASEVAQRIFIPLENIIMDLAEQYKLHATGGSIVWGLQEGPSETNPPTQFMQTFRIYANEKYADVRVACGKVYDPIEDDTASEKKKKELGFGTTETIMEVTVSPKTFVAESGDKTAKTKGEVKLHYQFDRAGRVFFRAEGETFLTFKKTLEVHVKETFTLKAKNSLMEATGGWDVKAAHASIDAKAVRLGPRGDQRGVARMGDAVKMLLPVAVINGQVTLDPATGPKPFSGTIVLTTALPGFITTASVNTFTT